MKKRIYPERSRRIDASLILACYNEEPIFASCVREIIHVLKNSRFLFEIIFVDDGSGDQTVDLINQTCRAYPFCRAMVHNKNTGRGRSVVDGIRSSQGTVVGYIDIDCEVSPVYIPEMVSLILEKKAEVVIGKRIYRTSLSWLPREVLSRGYRWLSDVVLGTGGMDTETGYKFFNRKKILPILKKTKHPGWFWDTEIMVRARRSGLNILEYPVLFVRRNDKTSTVRVVHDTIDYLASLLRFRKQLNGR